jgi:hypothetical protein
MSLVLTCVTRTNLWYHSSYEEAAELMRSFTLDLATETSTSTRYEAGVWIGSSYVVPIFNTHGINWVKFGVYEQGISQSSLPEEEGDTIIKLVRQHGKSTIILLNYHVSTYVPRCRNELRDEEKFIRVFPYY